MRNGIYWVAIFSVSSCVACEADRSGSQEDRDRSATERQDGLGEVNEPSRAEEPRVQAVPSVPSGPGMPNQQAMPEDERDIAASADIQAAEGTDIDGEAKFTTSNGQGVKIVVNVEKAPVGEKGIHIHEKGDCSDIRGKSMGSHFAPQGDKHGLPTDPQDQIHLGDLGNIEVKSDGTGKKEITLAQANLKEGDPMSLLGKALVIHEAKDQGASAQPSGGSGSPIACGVIEKD